MKKTDILISTYNRRKILQLMVESIKERTKTPYRLIIVDNCSRADDTIIYLKWLKKKKEVDVVIFNNRNYGASIALNQGFTYVKSELFITSDDDIIPPDLSPDWLSQLIKLFKKYYPEYGAIALRNARMINTRFGNESLPHYPNNEIGESNRSMCSYLRIQKRSDILKMSKLFGKRSNFASLYFYSAMKKIGFRTGYAKNIWSNHIGYGSKEFPNKGYPIGFTDYKRYSIARNKNIYRKPYPIIDDKTNIPLGLVNK